MRLLLFFVLFSFDIAGVPFFVRNGQNVMRPMRWNAFPIPIFVNTATASSISNNDVMTELNAAFDQWKTIPQASINFTLNTTASSSTIVGGEPDFVNFISFASAGQFSPDVIAITFTTADQDTGRIVDADMQFNKGNFVFLTQAQGPSSVAAQRIVLRSVATHEVGHLLGFDHSPMRRQIINTQEIPESTMFPYFSDDQLSLEEDDKSLASVTYPGSNSKYTATIEGTILSGQNGDTINGAHVIAWDSISGNRVAISAISGVTQTGVNFNGYYKINGLPQGNYRVLIEPFPIQTGSNTVTLSNNFRFLNNLDVTQRANFLNRSPTFPFEFWHDSAESSYEPDAGTTSATLFALTNGAVKKVDFITNQGTVNPNLSRSTLTFGAQFLYADGNTSGASENKSWTRMVFTARDAQNTAIPADISSRLQCQISTGSFSRDSVLRLKKMDFVGDGSFSYTCEIYSPVLPGNALPQTAKVNVLLDNVKVFTPDRDLFFERASKSKSTVELIPDIVYGLKKTGTQIFGNANPVLSAPGTFRIQPRFSDGSLISAEISTSTSTTFLRIPSPPTGMTTTPLVSIGSGLYQATASFTGIGAFKASVSLDGALLDTQMDIVFNTVSNISPVQLIKSSIHIQRPDITTSAAEIRLRPSFSDGSVIPFFNIPLSEFQVTAIRDDDQTVLTGAAVTGPFILLGDGLTESTFPVNVLTQGFPYYKSRIFADSRAGTAKVNVRILGLEMKDKPQIFFDVTSAAETEILVDRPYLLRNSIQQAKIEVIPRFSDKTKVNLDLASSVFLSTSKGFLRNATGDVTSTGLFSIHPSASSEGGTIRLTLALIPDNQLGTVRVTGSVNANGFETIGKPASLQFVDPSQDLLRVQLLDTALPADGQSITTVVLTPLFPDGTPIGPELSADRLKASISDGTLLRRVQITNQTLALIPSGKDKVAFVNNQDGTYLLSVRCTNFTTLIRLSLYVDDILSLTERELQCTAIGSADQEKSEIRIVDTVLYADGISATKIEIQPRTVTGEPFLLPTSASVIVNASNGILQGSIRKNSDGTYTHQLQSPVSPVDVESEITVLIDGRRIQPNQTFKVRFVNLDISSITDNFVYPDNKLIDGFDSAILSRAIRDQICTPTTPVLSKDCRLDFNRDGFVNESDMSVLMGAYGKRTP